MNWIKLKNTLKHIGLSLLFMLFPISGLVLMAVFMATEHYIAGIITFFIVLVGVLGKLHWDFSDENGEL